jgi:hypothetical protein
VGIWRSDAGTKLLGGVDPSLAFFLIVFSQRQRYKPAVSARNIGRGESCPMPRV